MSLDYICYALAKRPLTPQKVAAASPEWCVEFVDPVNGKPLHKSRALPSFCVILGCPRSARLDLATLVRAASSDGLTQLERRSQLGCCTLQIETDLVANPEFLAELPPRHRRVLAAAKSRYDTRSSASRGGNLSWPLQAAVCRAVALAVGGLLEDPQTGTFQAVRAKG